MGEKKPQHQQPNNIYMIILIPECLILSCFILGKTESKERLKAALPLATLSIVSCLHQNCWFLPSLSQRNPSGLPKKKKREMTLKGIQKIPISTQNNHLDLPLCLIIPWQQHLKLSRRIYYELFVVSIRASWVIQELDWFWAFEKTGLMLWFRGLWCCFLFLARSPRAGWYVIDGYVQLTTLFPFWRQLFPVL